MTLNHITSVFYHCEFCQGTFPLNGLIRSKLGSAVLWVQFLYLTAPQAGTPVIPPLPPTPSYTIRIDCQLIYHT